MKLHKPMKFPFELTKGKAEDLYRLRFMRRSELEPLLRHTMRHNNKQLGRQLDLWYKEKSMTIGCINKEHDKVYQSQQRLRKELRRIKKEDYARLQTEIREKLLGLRYRMITLKVLRKFRENVERNKREREKIIDKRFEVANYVLSVPTQTDYPECTSEFKKPVKDTKLTRGKTKSAKVIQRDTVIRSFQTRTLNRTDDAMAERKPEKTAVTPISHSSSQSRDYKGYIGNKHGVINVDDDEEEDDDVPLSLQGRYPSSKGQRMETILEEKNDDIDIEIDDSVGHKLTIASKKLISLRSSKSNRNIFESNEQVPLLPEVTQFATRQREGNNADKGTQTPFKHTKRRQNTDTIEEKTVTRRKLVVKLPSPILSPTSGKTIQSSSSTYGQFGSDTDGGYPDSISDTDDGFYFDSDTVEPSIELSSEIAVSPPSSDDTIEDNRQMLSISLDNYKETLKRKEQNSAYSTFLQQQDEVSFENFDAFPVRAIFPKQNPFALRFKERSFYLQSGFDEIRTSSARSPRRSQSEFRKETDTLEEIRDNRLADIQTKMTKEATMTHLGKNPTIAVFGVKADGRQLGIAPPNSPQVPKSISGFGQRNQNHPRVNLQVETQNHKKAQLFEKQKLHELVSVEPPQSNERTHYSQYSQLGSPRACIHDVSAMKSLYYRDKLLKAEREKIFYQNMRMKKFINAFDHVQERTHEENEARAARPISRTSSKSSPWPKKTFSSFMFEANNKSTDEINNAKIAPSTSGSSQRMLKDCRYLRDYISVPDKDYIATFQERRTSWQKKSDLSSYYQNYIANVRLQLS